MYDARGTPEIKSKKGRGIGTRSQCNSYGARCRTTSNDVRRDVPDIADPRRNQYPVKQDDSGGSRIAPHADVADCIPLEGIDIGQQHGSKADPVYKVGNRCPADCPGRSPAGGSGPAKEIT